MRKWRAPLWILAAFIALFAMISPSIAWACPMTGRIGTTAAICDHATATIEASSQSQSFAPAQCCLHPADGKCCKPVQLPGGENQKGTPLSLAQATSSHSLIAAQFAKALNIGHIVAVLPTTPAIAPALHGCLNNETEVSPSLFSEHTPLFSAGRAPPRV